MPLVNLRIPSRDIDISRRMPTPKKVGNVWKWFDEARKVIPEIPNVILDGWGISQQGASTERVSFEMQGPSGEAAFVVIDRTIPYVG